MRKPKNYVKAWTLDDRISESFFSNRVLRIEYVDGEGNKTIRNIYPLIQHTCELGFELLYSYCELRDDFRSFRVDRIKDAVLLYRSFDASDFADEVNDVLFDLESKDRFIIMTAYISGILEESSSDGVGIRSDYTEDCPLCGETMECFVYGFCENEDCPSSNSAYYVGDGGNPIALDK